MVSFSFRLPAVDSRKLAFPDHWTSSSKRKLVSPVSLGILLSFIAVSAVFVNVSSKGPFLNPLFQRLNIFGYHSNSSLLYWPFSGSAAYTESCSTTASGCNVTAIVQTAQNLVSETHEQNATEGARSSEIVSSDNKSVPEKLQNGSFVKKIHKEDGSEYAENSILDNSSGKRMEQDNAHFGDFTEDVKNSDGSAMANGSTNNSSPPFESNNTSSGGEFQSRLDGNISNYSYVGDDGSEGARAPATISASLSVCDVFDGRWVRDETKPYYPPGSCPYIDRDFDCHINGRADNEYEKWRWQPYNCDVPRLNATDFLERLRGQKLVFVGDSLNRNMWESLVCLLRHEVEDKSRVYEISGRHEFKKKGFYAFRFEDYNCSVDFVSSPFLVKESSFNRKNGSIETLRLDLMDGTTHMYHDADVIIFNTGHWWTHEKTSRGEDYYQEGNHVHTRLKVLEAYKRALITWARWVDTNVDTNKTRVIFRGFSATHFRGGPWNSGGQCQKETEPIFNETFLSKYPSKMRVLDYVLNDMKTPVIYLNISRLTDYRKDGHPSIYRPDYQAARQEVHAQDCSHWCLPGVPDTWNELLYASLLKSGRGSWSWRH